MRERRPVLDDVAEETATLSADMLPPAIVIAPLPEAEEVPVPKRRGRPKKVVDEVVAEG